MKLPEFNHSTRKWDRFREFYNEIANTGIWYGRDANPFIQLETGEFFLNRGRFTPIMRKKYEDLNISIFGSTDPAWSSFLNQRGARMTTPGGEQVLPTWLSQGSYQTLVIDHDTNHVVRSTWPHSSVADQVDKRIPPRLRGIASVYWSGDKEPPVGRAPLSVSQPDPLSKADQQHVDAIVAACKAWDTLSDDARLIPTANTWATTLAEYDAHGGYQRVPNPQYIAPEKFDVAKLLNMNFTDMTWGEKKQLALRGLKSRRKTTELTHLIIT